jgi:hypothetical protein
MTETMKQTVKLRTSEGKKIRVVLDNRASGLDDILRRWTFEDGCWQRTDTGELAQESGLPGLQVLSGRNPVLQLLAPVEGR